MRGWEQTVGCVESGAGAPGRAVGRKAAARVCSERAGTAARPRALLCNLWALARTEERYLRAILSGVREEAARHGAALVGGDLAASRGPLGLGVSGHCEPAVPGKPPGRDRARPGVTLEKVIYIQIHYLQIQGMIILLY